MRFDLIDLVITLFSLGQTIPKKALLYRHGISHPQLSTHPQTKVRTSSFTFADSIFSFDSSSSGHQK